MKKQLKNNSGLTLVELIIVVAIISVIAVIAYPSYQSHILRTWRAAATGCMLELANSLERRYTTSSPMSYAGALPALNCRTENDLNQHYTFAARINPQTFTITGQPVGAQTSDTVCETLTLNEIGTRTKSGTGSVADCW